MVTAKKKLLGVKIMWIVMAAIIVATAATGGVLFVLLESDSKSEGIYFRYVENEKVQNCWIELKDSDTWLNSEGLTGTYTRNGKTITFSGEGLAESMVGTIDGDQISFSSGGNGIIYGQTTPEGAADTEHNFVITLDAQGGILGGGTTSVNAIYGAAMPTLVAPARPGYDFVGYFDQATSGVQYYDATMTSKLNWNKLENATLYAQWVGTNSIIFDQQGGTGGTESVEIVAGADMPSATAPKKVGHTFIGYFDSKEGGTQYYSANMTSMHICDKQAGTIFYARWTANTYTVTFEKGDGTGGSASITATYGQAMPGGLTAPTRENYTFAGYFDDDGKQYYNADMLSVNTWEKATDSTLFAHWTGKTCTVTFNPGAGTGGSASVTATFGEAMPGGLTPPSLNGYTFEGYFDEQTGGTMYYNDKMVSQRSWDKAEDTTLYSHWKVNMYTVTFEKGDGTGGSTSVTATFGEAMPGGLTAPSLNGYTFAGYFDKVDGGGTMYYNDKMVSQRSWDKATASTLFAHWEEATNGFHFIINTDESGYIVTGYDGSDTEIFIPAKYKKLPVTEIGDNAFQNKSTITSVTIPGSVKTIGEYAFQSTSSALATVTFGEGSQLQTIGAGAFKSSGLTSITIPDSVTAIVGGAFEICTELKTVTFGAASQLGTIEMKAFASSGLTNITIPDNVTAIGYDAFSGCQSLTTVTFGTASKLETIGIKAFAGSVLTSIAIPGNVITIENHAFADCTVLATVTFGEFSKLETIGDNAFQLTSISNITIPASVIAIGVGAFTSCNKLTSITIPSGVATIGANAFSGCINLTIYAEAEAASKPVGWDSIWNNSIRPVVWGVKLSEDKTYIVSYIKATIDNPTATGGITAPYREGFTFGGWSSTKDGTKASYTADLLNTAGNGLPLFAIWEQTLNGLVFMINADESEYAITKYSGTDTAISIPTMFKGLPVTTIGESAFYSSAVKTVTFGEDSKLEKIKMRAFQISDLTSIAIPKSVTIIDMQAFNACQKLKTVTFVAGSLLKTIGYGAYWGSYGLTSITIPSGVATIGAKAFIGCTNLTIYTDAASKPGAWESLWNESNRPIVWGVTLEKDNTYVVSYMKAPIDNYTATGGIKAPYREGYTFGGWSIMENGTSCSYTAEELSTAPNGQQLYAIWKLNP